MFGWRKLLIVFVCTLVARSGPSAAQCIVLNIYEPEGYAKGKSISVGLFSMEGSRIAGDAGPIEKPRQILIEELGKDLKKTKYFSSVTVVAADQKAEGHYLLEGQVAGVHGGSRAMRITIGGTSAAGQMRVAGRLYGPPQAAGPEGKRLLISDWECNRFDMGGFFGLGSNETAARKNADKIARSISREVFGKLDKRADELVKRVSKDAKKGPIVGKSHSWERTWRDKSDWKADDYADEIESFVIKSDRERARGVDGIWLTRPCYRAHQKLLPMLRQTAILRRKEIRRGMVTDLGPLTPFEGADVYALAVTCNVSFQEAPFVWRSKQIRDATFLTRKGDKTAKLAPVEFLDLAIPSYVVFDEKRVFKAFSTFWAYHPAVVIFPTKLPDGSGLVRSLDDVVELRTEVDGRPVLLEFNLKHFGLASVDELRMAEVKTVSR